MIPLTETGQWRGKIREIEKYGATNFLIYYGGGENIFSKVDGWLRKSWIIPLNILKIENDLCIAI